MKENPGKAEQQQQEALRQEQMELQQLRQTLQEQREQLVKQQKQRQKQGLQLHQQLSNVPKVSPGRERNMNQGDDDFTENETEENDTCEPLPNLRYRYKDGRYYYDRRETEESGSVDMGLDYDAEWKPGPHVDKYVTERDRTLEGRSRIVVQCEHEIERLAVGKEKTYEHFFKQLPDYYDVRPKPLYEQESINEKQGRIYLIRHKILELFHNLTTLLVFHRPDNPREFIINHLQSLIDAREGFPSPYDLPKQGAEFEDPEASPEIPPEEMATTMLPRVFSQADIEGAFSLMEPCGCGRSTVKRVQHAFKSMGMDEILAEDPLMRPLPEDDPGTVNVCCAEAAAKATRNVEIHNVAGGDATAAAVAAAKVKYVVKEDLVVDLAMFEEAAERGAIEQAKTFYPRRWPRREEGCDVDFEQGLHNEEVEEEEEEGEGEEEEEGEDD